MTDLMLIGLYALSGGTAVALAGALVLRVLRDRSIAVHIGVLLTVTVIAVVAGVVIVAWAMFLSPHDLQVVLLTVVAAAVVSLAAGVLFGRRLARAAVWAADARATERRLEKGRRDLVAWVSHDLRTPLAGLRAMAEALEDGVVSDPETVADYHRRIRGETDRMSELVDDLFELSRINAGALRLSLASVSLSDVISDAIASAVPLATAAHVNLVSDGHDWPTVRGSEPELSRIVSNLLRNAIRHTPTDGTVTVSGGLEPAGGWFAVQDSCGGIPEPDLPRVFDVAFRGASARTPEKDAGGGLGLAIVKGLVEAHRGQVAVANVDGGCRFEVHLPGVA